MRKFTIFCLNPEVRTTCFLLVLISLATFGCKSNYQDPKPQDAGLYGAWQENVVYNFTYENNILIKADTLAAMSNKAEMYTVFKKDGTFEAYEVNGANTIIDEFDGPFNYDQTGGILSQTWPAPASVTTADKFNVGALRSGFASPSLQQVFNYIATVNSNTISLSAKIQITGAASDGNYVLQVRKLARY